MRIFKVAVICFGLFTCACQTDFTASSSGMVPIYRMNVDGSNARSICQSLAAYKSFPTLSPDGKYLCYWTNCSSEKQDLYLFSIDDGNETYLTSQNSISRPVWAGGSQHILVPHKLQAETGRYGFRILDVLTKQITELPFALEQAYHSIQFAKIESGIFFGSTENEKAAVYHFDINSKKLTLVKQTNDPRVRLFSLPPDEGWLILEYDCPNIQIEQYNVSNGDSVILSDKLDHRLCRNRFFLWSKNSGSLAFFEFEYKGEPSLNLITQAIDGSAERVALDIYYDPFDYNWGQDENSIYCLGLKDNGKYYELVISHIDLASKTVKHTFTGINKPNYAFVLPYTNEIIYM